MTWVRVDQDFDEHPKIAAVGPLGGFLFIRSLCYCNRNLTDGRVSDAIIKRLTFDMEPGAKAMTDLMVEAGLWEREAGGVRVHDYLDYNPSKAQVEALRRERVEAGRRGGLAKAKQSASNLPSKILAKVCPDPDPVRDRSVVTPKIQSDVTAPRSTRRKMKTRKPGSYGRL